jgi:ribosomal protein S16
MCYLIFKLRISGKKNQEFAQFILQRKNIRQRGKFFATMGSWDLRRNPQFRVQKLSVVSLLDYCSFGAQLNRTVLNPVYLYFLNTYQKSGWAYSSLAEIMLLLELKIIKNLK